MNDMMKGICELARKNFENDGELVPVVIAMGDRGIIAPMFFGNPEEKEAVYAKVKRVLKQNNTKEYCFVSEVWMKSMRRGDEYVQPSKSGDREEAVTVTYANTSGETGFARAAINRPFDGSKPSLGEFEDLSDVMITGSNVSFLT